MFNQYFYGNKFISRDQCKYKYSKKNENSKINISALYFEKLNLLIGFMKVILYNINMIMINFKADNLKQLEKLFNHDKCSQQ